MIGSGMVLRSVVGSLCYHGSLDAGRWTGDVVCSREIG